MFLSEEFSNNSLALTRCGILITDLQRRIIHVSRTVETMFGYPASRLLNQSLDILMLKEDLTYFVPNIYKITQERGSFQGEILLVCQTGESLYGHLTTHLYPGDAQQPSVVILTVHDISMIKHLEKNYLDFNKLTSLGRLTESITREMRIPIMSISGFAERMDQSLPQESPLRSYLAILRKEITALETIIIQVEELASLPQPEYKKEDLVDVIQALLEDIPAPKPGRDSRPHLKISLESQDRTLYVDRPLIHKALKIITDTVLEVLPRDATLALHVHSNAEYFIIDVHSPRSGIPSDDIGRILDSCFSSRPQIEDIRLVAAHRIIDEQGGKLETFNSPQEGAFHRISLLKERRRKIRSHLI